VIKKVLLFSFGGLLVSVVCGILVLYQFFGLREYFQFRKYLANLPDDEATETTSNFYSGVSGQMAGGVLAAIWEKGLWLWGKTGLVFYKFADDSSFLYLHGCTPNGLKLAGFVGDENVDLYNPEKNEEVADWRKKIYRGIHIFVVDAGKYFVAHPDVKITNHPLIFCQQSIDLYE